MYCGFYDGEAGAEVYSTATKKDQAKICHNDATEMVKRSKQLQKEINSYRNNLHSVRTSSKFEPLSSDSNSLDGLNVHAAIADEVHAWKGDKLWGVIDTAMGSRLQPLMLAITTAGTDKQGICYRQREYVERVLKGIIEDDSYWGIIYTLDTKTDWPDLESDDDWQNPDNWIKANPLLGVSKYVRTMQQAATKAANSPSELNNFLRWHLNIWTTATARWVNPIQWAECGRETIPNLDGRLCYGALDLSTTLDISAWVKVFPPKDDDDLWYVDCQFWIPEENIEERVRRDRVPYDVWIREGLIETTPGNVIDYDWIEAAIKDDLDRYHMAEIAFDPWNATSVSNHLMEEGAEMVEFRQGFVSMNPAMKALEVAIAENRIAHGGNAVLSWMADNLVARLDPAGNMKPDKEASREKIDGMVALLMAHYRATLGGGYTKSVYEKRGLRVL